MKVGINDARDHGSVAHVHNPRIGSSQFPHFPIASQSHDPLAFDGHRFNDGPWRIGNGAPIIHGDDLAVHQNAVRIALLCNQGMQLRESDDLEKGDDE